jgi:MinD-like ATPase involved in chromosome partitioning or flagellar assembly
MGVRELDDDVFTQLVAKVGDNLSLVLGSLEPERAELVSLPAIQATLEHLRRRSDYVLVDTPVGFSETNLTALDEADLICLVTTSGLAAMTATLDGLHVLDKLKIPRERRLLVVNRVGRGAAPDEVTRFFSREPDLTIPEDIGFEEAENLGRLLLASHPQGLGAAGVRRLAGLAARRVPAPV